MVLKWSPANEDPRFTWECTKLLVCLRFSVFQSMRFITDEQVYAAFFLELFGVLPESFIAGDEHLILAIVVSGHKLAHSTFNLFF